MWQEMIQFFSPVVPKVYKDKLKCHKSEYQFIFIDLEIQLSGSIRSSLDLEVAIEKLLWMA